MADTPDIRVIVGVDGDGKIDGKSGQLILKDLNKIAKEISKTNAPQIAFNIDIEKTTKNFNKQFSDIIKNIKVAPIKIDFDTSGSPNQSYRESFIDDAYKKLIDDTNGKKSKANIIAHIEEKRALADITVQKAKDVEVTKKQTTEAKKLKEIISQLSFLGSTEQTSKYNSILNNVDKLGLSNLENQLKQLEQYGKELKLTLDGLMGDTSNMLPEDFSKKFSEVFNSSESKELLENTKKYYIELERIEKLSRQDNASFTKDTRNAKNIKDLETLITKLKNYKETNDKFKNDFGLNTQFESILRSAESLKASGVFSGIDVDTLRQKFMALDGTITEMGLKGQTSFGKLRAQIEKLGIYFSASAIMMGGWRQIQQMTTNVIELDTAMTELKKVTDETDTTYSKFLDNAEGRAKKLGATLTDTIRSTADAARMGYSLSEAESLADSFNIYRNVGDGVKDIEQASSTIISNMKAFGIAASDSMQIVDVYNEVSNNFAVRSDEIGLAVADMGAAFAGAGNSMEESIAVYTGMNEIIQDWSKSSTAMRTISARLRNTAGALEELGIDSEGAAESVTKLQTQLLNITKGKVDIMASPNEFKNTTQILRELSSVWDSLTDKDRADVTRLVAGTRQQSTLQAVLSNWKQVEEAIETAIDSEGSAYTENDKYLESIRGRAAQFQAQYEALSNAIISSELIKGSIDTGTGFMGGLTWIIDNLKLIPTLATVAAGALSAINNNGISKMNMPLPTLFVGTAA